MRKFFSAATLAVILAAAFWTLAVLPEAALAAAKKKTEPFYSTSGSIPGTALSYENLQINDFGKAIITVYNPDNTGVSFSANFSFYTKKNAYLTGFHISGFAAARSRATFFADVPTHASLKKASYMKVLGRAGRASGE